MKDYIFTIKVADFLAKPGTKDTVQFINKFSTLLPHLNKNGLSCLIEITSLSDEQILLNFTDIKAVFSVVCDSCMKETLSEVFVPYISVKAVVTDLFEDKEDQILLDKKNGVVNVESFLAQVVLIELPVTFLCNSCLNKEISIDENDEEKSNILWIQK